MQKMNKQKALTENRFILTTDIKNKNVKYWNIFLILFSTAVPLSGQNNYALFFAVDNYSSHSSFKNLKNPIKDAKSIATELSENYGFETEIHENPSKEVIFQVLKEWQNKHFNEDEQLFVFFSGHGTFWEFVKKGYFVPAGLIDEDYDAYLDLTDIGNIVTQIPCEHILLAIDACYSGTITKEIAFKGNIDPVRPGESKDAKTRFLKAYLKDNSRLLITSGKKERVPDGDKHSPFAWGIIKALREAYTIFDGLLTYSDLLSKLERVTPIPHEGTLEGDKGGGFVFASKYSRAKTITTNQNNRTPEIISQAQNSFTTSDGQSYTFKLMKDGKTWMTQNLNLEMPNSWCYQDDQRNCALYGRLYSLEAAVDVCESLGYGWKLPSAKEWENLGETYGGFSINKADGEHLDFEDPHKLYYEIIGLKNDDSSRALGGIRFLYESGDYLYSIGRNANYWTRTEFTDETNFSVSFSPYYQKFFVRQEMGKQHALSVRCIKE